MVLKIDHANDIDYVDDVHFHPCPSHQLNLWDQIHPCC